MRCCQTSKDSFIWLCIDQNLRTQIGHKTEVYPAEYKCNWTLPTFGGMLSDYKRYISMQSNMRALTKTIEHKLDINLNSDIHHTFLYFYLEDHLLFLYILTVANLHARLDGLTSYNTLDMNLDIKFNHSQWSIKCRSYSLLLLGCWPTP